jgi:hypothetical protein
MGEWMHRPIRMGDSKARWVNKWAIFRDGAPAQAPEIICTASGLHHEAADEGSITFRGRAFDSIEDAQAAYDADRALKDIKRIL